MNMAQEQRSSHHFLWLGLLLFVVFSIAFLLPILPNDFWWYLRLGGDILMNGEIPSVDTYTSTIYGTPQVYPMWLSAIFFFWIHEFGGLPLIGLIRGIMIGAFFVVLWLTCARQGLPGWLIFILSFLNILAGANNWAVRPQMFVYPLFGITLWVVDGVLHRLDQCKESYRFRLSRWEMALIPISALWANLHGSVIILFFLLVPMLFENRLWKKYLLIIGVCFLATLINPRGILLWSDTFSLLNSGGNEFSREWAPPTNSHWQMYIFFAWLLAMIPLVGLSRTRYHVPQWFWLLGFGWMALSGTRYVIWFLAILLVLSAKAFGQWKIIPFNPTEIRKDRFQLAMFFVLLILPLVFLPGIRQVWWDQAPPSLSADTPVEAVDWLKKHPEIPRPLFNNYVFGSYLEYAIPDLPVWIDTRFYPFPKEIWQDYLSISNAEPEWEQKLESYGIASLILDPNAQTMLVEELNRKGGWCKEYQDLTAVIYIKCQP